MPMNHANFLAPLQQGIIQKLLKTRQHLLHPQPVHIDLTPPSVRPNRATRRNSCSLILLPDRMGTAQAQNGDIQTNLINFDNRPCTVTTQRPDNSVIFHHIDPHSIAYCYSGGVCVYRFHRSVFLHNTT